jgi:NUMOD3 motif
MITINCLLCGRENGFSAASIAKGRGKYCSPEHYFQSLKGKHHGHKTCNGKTWKLSKKSIEKIRKRSIGRKASAETRKKQSLARMGKHPWNYGKPGTGLGNKEQQKYINHLKGKDVWNYKGDEIGYSRKHQLVYIKSGKATRCDYKYCMYPRKTNQGRILLAPKAFHWANISHEYKPGTSDYMQLCASCHSLYDRGKLTL